MLCSSVSSCRSRESKYTSAAKISV